MTRKPSWVRLTPIAIVVCGLLLWIPGCSAEEGATPGSTTLVTTEEAADAPRNAAVDLGNRADHAREASDYEEAIRLYDQAIEVDAGYTDAYIGKGWALLDAKDFEEAERWAELTTRLFPRSDIGWLQLGYSNERLGNFEQAIPAYERVLDLARPMADAAARAESRSELMERLGEIRGGSLSGTPTLDLSGVAESKTSLVSNTERRVALLYYISAITKARESALAAESDLTELAQSNADLPKIAEQVQVVIARLRGQIDTLDAIVPPSHFQPSHAEMTAAIRDALEGYEAMSTAMEDRSNSRMDAALKQLDEARNRLADADALLRDLIETYYDG